MNGVWPAFAKPTGVTSDIAVCGRPGQVCSIAWSELTLASNDEHEVALDALYSLFYDEDEESLDSSSLKDTDDSSSSHDAAEEGKPSSFPKEAVEKPTRSRPWKVPHPRVQPLTSLLNHLVSRPARAQLRHPQPHQAPRRLAVQQQPPLPRRPSLPSLHLLLLLFLRQLFRPSQLVVTPVLQFPRVNCRLANGQQTTLNVANVKVLILTSGGHVMLSFVIARERLLLLPITA